VKKSSVGQNSLINLGGRGRGKTNGVECLALRNSKYFSVLYHKATVTFGDVVVSVLATGPKVRGFKPGRGRWILRVIKSVARLPSEEK
jgi:hypothetical protein